MERLVSGAAELGLSLNSHQLEQFATYYRELMAWNQRMNLTAITVFEEVQIKHFLDSLTVTLALKESMSRRDIRIMDVGTGSGIPGVPLKILFPDIRLVLLDATAKKATFLQHLRGELKLDNVDIVVGRAEEVAHQSEYRERFDIVLSRAVASLPTLVELTLPFCAIGGSFIAQKNAGIDPEIRQAAKAIGTLGGSLREVIGIDLAEFTGKRQLIVIDKIFPTPAQYPRRPGIPAKNPLGE